MLIVFSVHLFMNFHPNFNIYMIIKVLLILPPKKLLKKLGVSKTFD